MAATIKHVTDYLEGIAPLAYQEDYDNAGLITGNPSDEVSGILITLDCTEAVIEEAISNNCNLIVAHHPILFKSLKKLTGQTYVERVIIKAIQHCIGLYAIHTNLDNIHTGVNKRIAHTLGLQNIRILKPTTQTLIKLVTFIPHDYVDAVMEALHKAGAGNIGNYSHCSFKVLGEGTFLPTGNAKPTVGEVNKLEKTPEVRAEVLFPAHLKKVILSALKATHPYEEVAYYLSSLENENQEVGAGMVGELPIEEDELTFLQRVKESFKTGCVRHTPLLGKKVKTVAVCGGAGSFLLRNAISANADVFISSDFKYHEFFDSDGKIIIADIGHYESEQFTKELLEEFLKEKFHTFAIIFSKTRTNPISYL